MTALPDLQLQIAPTNETKKLARSVSVEDFTETPHEAASLPLDYRHLTGTSNGAMVLTCGAAHASQLLEPCSKPSAPSQESVYDPSVIVRKRHLLDGDERAYKMAKSWSRESIRSLNGDVGEAIPYELNALKDTVWYDDFLKSELWALHTWVVHRLDFQAAVHGECWNPSEMRCQLHWENTLVHFHEFPRSWRNLLKRVWDTPFRSKALDDLRARIHSQLGARGNPVECTSLGPEKSLLKNLELEIVWETSTGSVADLVAEIQDEIKELWDTKKQLCFKPNTQEDTQEDSEQD